MTSPQLDEAHQLGDPIPSPRPSPRALFQWATSNATPVADPTTAPGLDPLPGETALPQDEAAAGWGSDPDPSSDEWNDPSDDPTSSPTSSGKPLKIGKAAAKATAAKGVLIASGIVHQQVTRPDTPQRAAGLFLADQEDAENIGHPLGEIMARRSGVAGKALSPDANDALSMLFGLAGYASKQIAKHMAILNAAAGPAPAVDL